uniref:SWIM-type domain-containing protein n=1 Tax=Cajanus cajan TaxID=3821 RepID=A0A151SA94_CAJCA|nr:hypothetical protein KK1_026543 [Cajanus cajan]
MVDDIEIVHQIDEEYISDELHNDLDDSDSDFNSKPKYRTFHGEDMCKEFKFQLGMEFRSLKEFKDAILEHAVLNGGLVQMFEEMMEGVEHRLCLRHLYENFKKKFGGGTMIRDLMMAAAKATYEEAWRGKMNELKALNKKAYDWLVAISTKAWCKHAFSFYPSCDVLMNNLSEEFNSTILLARDKPIITMFEWIRTYIMALFATLNKKFSKYNGRVMPKPRKRLDREIQMSGNWLATWASELKFEVTHTIFCDKFIVNLGAYSCTCNFWELVGIPCRHVVAAICMRGDKPEDYVHQYYLRETYAKCYGQTISPINGQNKWYVTNNDTILPPDFKRGPSRPKKLRRRMLEEDENPTKLRRTHTSNRCGRCLQYGHNKRNCPNPLKQPEGGGEQQQQPTTTKSKVINIIFSLIFSLININLNELCCIMQKKGK